MTDSTRILKLSNGVETLVDAEDFEVLSKYFWYEHRNKRNKNSRVRGRAYLNGRLSHVFIHRFLLNAPKDKEVDHINQNPLDNRKVNLRLCSRKQNCGNQAPKNGRKYKGIYKVKNRWRVLLADTHMGYFSSLIEAIETYNEGAIKLYGEFAYLNSYDGE